MSRSLDRVLRLVPSGAPGEASAKGSGAAGGDTSANPAGRDAPALDDSALLAGVRERDPSVCGAFYARVRPIVDRTLSRLLGARDPDYDDVAQIALFELVTSVPRFRGECPLDAWLSIVTARAAYQHIRKRKSERGLFTHDLQSDANASVRTLPAAFASREAIERVRAHLRSMDDRRAWTFLLHDVYGYDLRETGEIMGVSLSAAQSRLVRGRRELHDRIRDDVELAGFFDDLGEERP